MTDLVNTYIENRQLVQPNHANNLGTIHGGNVLKWMDEAGAMSAMRFAGSQCVTAHIHNVDFEQSIEVGEIILTESYVYRAGETSVHVRVRAYRENPQTGETNKTTESYFVFVAIDENGEAVSVPNLTVSTEEEKQLQEEAKANYDSN